MRNLDAEIAQAAADRNVIFKQMDSLRGVLVEANNRHTLLIDEKIDGLDLTGSVPGDLDFLVEQAEWSTKANKALDTLAQDLGASEARLLRASKYDEDGAETSHRISAGLSFLFKQNQNVGREVEAVIGWHKMLGERTLTDGWLFIDFLEEGLSEAASYSARWNPKTGEARVVRMRHYSEAHKNFDSLTECLSFVAENLWYEPEDGRRDGGHNNARSLAHAGEESGWVDSDD